MSLIGTIRAAINGTGTWSDVESKAIALAETGALDALGTLESFGANFLTKFAPAETQAVENAGVSLLTGSSVSTAAGTLLSQTEANAEVAAQSSLNPSTPATGS